MSEQGWIFLVGILVAATAYLSKTFIFEPIVEFRKVKGKIQNRIKYYSNILTNGKFPVSVTRPIAEEMRQLSCDLEEEYLSVSPIARKFYWLFGLPSAENLDEAARDLIFLSNSVGSDRIDENHQSIENVKKILKVYIK